MVNLHKQWELAVQCKRAELLEAEPQYKSWHQKQLEDLLKGVPFENGEVEEYEEIEEIIESSDDLSAAMKALLANKDAMQGWRNAHRRKPDQWWSRNDFRSCLDRRYQTDSEATYRIIKLYEAAGKAICKETGRPNQIRVTFRFTEAPPVERMTPTVVQDEQPLTLEEFEFQFVPTKAGNERARWNSECYVTLKSHSDETKWETCINVKKMKGVWSKLFPSRKAAIEDVWKRLNSQCK